MFKKMCVNVVFRGGRSFLLPLICVISLSAVGAVNYPPLAGAQGVDSYTKLMLHADGSDQGTSFTDSETTPKTITNTETYDSYSKLMLHMDNNTTDSAAGKAVTYNNALFSDSYYKWGGYSALLNGINAYLSLADSDDWNFGNGDFTIDFWVRFHSLPTGSQAYFYEQGGAANKVALFLFDNGTNNFVWYVQIAGGSGQIYFSRFTTVSTNVWYHIALVRSGNSWYMFQDGSLLGAVEYNSNTVPDISGGIYIGASVSQQYLYYHNGYIEEYRISKGIARWTSNFTPPSSSYGKVATVTSQKKFGTASGEFKGSGEYLSLADSDDWNLADVDWTIDFQLKFAALTGSQGLIQNQTDESNMIWIEMDPPSGSLLMYKNIASTPSNIFNITTVTDTNWHHIAIVHVESTSKYYVFMDGIDKSNGGVSNAAEWINYTGSLEIGRRQYAGWTYLNGWVDEFRVSKGIARWTSNFTSPTAPYETDTTLPTVSSTSPASGATGVGISTAISATFSEDMDSSTITTTTFTLTSSGGSVSGTVSYSNKTATFTPSSNLSYSTTYTATITTGVKDISGNAMSSNYTWSFTTSSAPDTTAPSGSVSINSGASYTNSTSVTLTLSATDTTGVTGYYLSDSSSTPSASASGWTAVTSTTSYSGTVSYSLSRSEGSKTIYAWYKDAAGNVSSTANATITYDTTAPTVTISSPTSSSTYTSTSSTISLGGSASDSTSGISSVTWSNNRGGNGTATGTASWTVSSISLSSGDNIITVTAKDGANNSGTDTLQVTYSTGTTVSAPTVSTGSASSVTTSSATLNGTVNANGVSTTAWFQYGSTSGSYGNTSSTQTATGSSNTTVSIGISGLSSSTKYYYRIAASNSGGTSYGSESSFTTSTASATPTPTPTPTPTAAPTATTTPKPTPTAQPTPTRPPTLPPLPTPQPSPSPATNGIVFGFVNDEDEQPLEGVTVTIVGANGRSPLQNSTETDENGYYEFSGLDAGEYAITYEKEGFLAQTTNISLEEGGLKDVETVILEQVERGKINGYAVNIKGSPIEFVRLKLKGIKTKVTKSASTDADGFFEFADMEADTYVIIAKKKGYRKNQQKVKLEEGASEEIEIVMKKTSKRIKGLLLEEDIQ